jgi:hypothetical protein
MAAIVPRTGVHCLHGLWVTHAGTPADRRKHVRHDPIRIFDEASPREPKDEPSRNLEPVRPDAVLLELELVAAPIELDCDHEIRIGEVDSVSMAEHIHAVLVHRRGKTGIVEQSLDESSELVVRIRLSPPSLEYPAVSCDPLTPPSSVKDEAFPELFPRRERAKSCFIERTERAIVVVDRRANIQHRPRNTGHGDPEPALLAAQLERK